MTPTTDAVERRFTPLTPLAITFTKERLQADAKDYMTRLYGQPSESGDADKWLERFGLLCAFIDEQFQGYDLED